MRHLLSSPNVYSVNLDAEEDAKRLVSHLVRLDRLPKHNPLEGLLLLQEVWAEYDVAMHLAGRYKNFSKTLFAQHLLAIWLAVLVATLFGSRTELFDTSADGLSCADDDGRALDAETADNLVFFLSLLPGLLISIESVLNSKARWR